MQYSGKARMQPVNELRRHSMNARTVLICRLEMSQELDLLRTTLKHRRHEWTLFLIETRKTENSSVRVRFSHENTSSHQRRAAVVPLSVRRAFQISNALVAVSTSPEPASNFLRASAAASRLSCGERNMPLPERMDEIVSVTERHPKTEPSTINFESLRSAGIAAR